MIFWQTIDAARLYSWLLKSNFAIPMLKGSADRLGGPESVHMTGPNTGFTLQVTF